MTIIIIAIGIGIAAWFSDKKKISLICTAILAVLGFLGPYIVNFAENVDENKDYIKEIADNYIYNDSDLNKEADPDKLSRSIGDNDKTDDNEGINDVSSSVNQPNVVDSINLIISCLQLFICVLPMLVILIKGIRSFRARELLCINLGKKEFKNFKFYITTYGQKVSPVDEDNIRTDSEHFNLIKFFIHDVFGDDKFGRYFIILADSGMGKSTFLQMLFLKYS